MLAIRTHVEFWGVGGGQTVLPMATSDISGHLLTDWVPSLPAAVGSSFVGWPPFLIEVAPAYGNNLLAVRTEASRSERQWKSVLSWMLGVAGARHVLASEGYRWVAPVSAFYSSAAQTVDLSAWHPSFPRSIIITSRRPRSRCRLCPDYLALRPIPQSAASVEWAVAEAKGTRRSLTNVGTCPAAWSRQARNLVLTVRGATVTVPRHLVIATRVNPGGAKPSTRRIQLRAWNQTHEAEVQLPTEAAVEIAAAHLFGLFRGLRMPQNASAIAAAVQARRAIQADRRSEPTQDEMRRLFEGAQEERRERTGRLVAAKDTHTAVDTELGVIGVNLAQPVLTLADALQQAHTPETAVEALRKADSELNEWQESRVQAREMPGTVVLPFGVEIQMPDSFEPRT